MEAMLLLNLIVPFVMLVVGFSLKKHPNTDMSRQNGYNTATSRKSQAHWDYAQNTAPAVFIRFGWIAGGLEILLFVVLLFLHWPIPISVAVGTLMGFLFMGAAFFYTERMIKRKFKS